MNRRNCLKQTDYGPNPFVANIPCEASENQNFRTAFWTGKCLQMTLMCIPRCGEIGVEMHEKTDQVIRVEQGKALVKIGKCEKQLEYQQTMCAGDVVFVPAGTWHNVINVGMCPLKVSSIYAPPHHPKGTVHRTKEEAEKAE